MIYKICFYYWCLKKKMTNRITKKENNRFDKSSGLTFPIHVEYVLSCLAMQPRTYFQYNALSAKEWSITIGTGKDWAQRINISGPMDYKYRCCAICDDHNRFSYEVKLTLKPAILQSQRHLFLHGGAIYQLILSPVKL